MAFEFATAARIIFGAGKASDVPAAVTALGVRRVLLVTGANRQRADGTRLALIEAAIEVIGWSVDGEPTVELVRDGVGVARQAACDGVLAIGGGSALDAGKALAALLPNGGEPLDFLEVIGRAQPLRRPSLPFIAMPTTAGTGSEVTRNAVLGSREHGVKASLRSPFMLPSLAVVDPNLLQGLPPAVLAAGGLDALSQLVEPLVSLRANPLTDAWARAGLVRSARSLRPAFLAGADASAREDLALASLLGGLCLANAGLGAVHGFAAPLGGRYHAPHGAVCAALLAAVMEANLVRVTGQEWGATERGVDVAARFDDIARLLTGDPAARGADGIAWVRALVADLRIPGLSRYGLTQAEIPDLIAQAKAASSMRGNPVVLTDSELSAVVERSL